jgi:hypothetical protein
VAVLTIGFVGCEGLDRQIVANGAGQQGQSERQEARRKAIMEHGEQIESLERTVLHVGNREVPVTREDAKAIQTALLAYLKTSNYPDREELLRWTQGDSSAWIDGEGIVRIGPWLLDAEDTRMFLRYREAPGQLAAKAHKAYLTRTDGSWKISELRAERIPVRR